MRVLIFALNNHRFSFQLPSITHQFYSLCHRKQTTEPKIMSINRIILIILIIYSLQPPLISAIVYRKNISRDNFAITQINGIASVRVKLPTTATTSLPSTVPLKKVVLNDKKPINNRRKFINDDYFTSTTDDSPWPVPVVYSSSGVPIQTNLNILRPPSLLNYLGYPQEESPQHQFLSPFGNEQKKGMPLYWGLRGYGLYSYSAVNDLHNNQPIGNYKYVREY